MYPDRIVDYVAGGTYTFTPDTGVTISDTGLVTAPAGTYTFTYTNAEGCTSAESDQIVLESFICAEEDTAGPVNGLTGGDAGINVLDNDTLNGDPINPADVTITPNTAGPLTVNADGTVTVAPNTEAGEYTVEYTVCENLNPTNCDTPDDVTITPNTEGPLTVNADGTVTVAPNTPAGEYTVEYTVCENLNPTNCDTATVTVTVEPAPIDAVDDAGTVSSGFTGGQAVANVLDNDTLNGEPVDPADVTLTQVSTTDPNVTLNPATGSVDVAPGTPSGTYTVVYQICENLNPTNCDTATVTVEVLPDSDGDGVLDAVEIANGTDPNDPCDYNVADITEPITSGSDCDGDGVLDATEVANGTDPHDPCDYNIADITEPITSGSDCDGDGVLDATEIANGTDPNDPCDYNIADITEPITSGSDCDGGVTNGQELIDGTDLLDPCDLVVASQTLDPSDAWNAADCDGDGVTNGDEMSDGTDPLNLCSFVLVSQTLDPSEEWYAADCDNDGLTNGEEVDLGTDPLNADTDGV